MLTNVFIIFNYPYGDYWSNDKHEMGVSGMTDNEIIKALECCYAKGKTCNDCPTNDFECTNIEKMALDLINRQKAKIKELEERCNKND